MNNIGVFFGGKSPEHDVSIITGQLIISELKKMDYSIIPVYIDVDGFWYVAEELSSLKYFTAKDFKENLKVSGWDKVSLDLQKSHGKMILKKDGIFGKIFEINTAFPALHGQNGEDGTLQGFFEMLDLEYVGCNVESSAVSMNKVTTKDLYRAHGVPTTNYLRVDAGEWKKNKLEVLSGIRNSLKKSVFVKPARLGSSIGIGKVKDSSSSELEFKIEVALHYDDLVIVEDAVEPVVDLTCAVIGYDNMKPSVIQESVFDADLFNFEEKYLNDGGAQLGNSKRGLVIPADIPEEVTKRIQTESPRILKIIGATGIARVDWLYNRETGELFANEINTLPGTLYHHLWKASGVELGEVIKILLDSAQKGSAAKKRLTHKYPSKLLEQAGSMKLPGSKLNN